MGRNVSVDKVDFKGYVNKLMKHPKISDRKMVIKIMLEFGEVIGDYFLILNNEFWDDYNSYYSMFILIDRYFGIDEWEDKESSHDIFLSMSDEMRAHKNQYGVAEKLGIIKCLEG